MFGFTGERFGAHAEYLTIPEDGALATIPTGMTYEQAAPGTEGAIYALSSITTGKVRRGQVVLVHGAIGSAAVQLLKVLGAQVTATCDTRHMQRSATW